jgi:lipid-binding SYLF domain-containing protein
MNTNRIVAVLPALVTLGLILSVPVFAVPLAPTSRDIDQAVTAALNDLYSQNDGARALGAKARAVLVFPDIKKGAFVIGAQWGIRSASERH